jgi:predicted kinase
MAQRLASNVGAIFLCVETRARDDIVRQRLEGRSRDASAVSDATWEIYLAQKDRFEPVKELSEWSHAIIDTRSTKASVAKAAGLALDERLSPAGLP